METCHYFNLTPKGLKIKKRAESARSEYIQRRWDDVLSDASRSLTKITIEEEITTMKIEEEHFWSGIDIFRSVSSGDVSITTEWLTKLKMHLKKLEGKLTKQKSRKLKDLSRELEEDVVARFLSRLEDFPFREQFERLCEDFYPEVNDIVTLVNLNESIESMNKSIFTQENIITSDSDGESVLSESAETPDVRTNQPATNRLEGKFVSKNVVNLSKRTLSSAEISLLSKGLKFIPTQVVSTRRKSRKIWRFLAVN